MGSLISSSFIISQNFLPSRRLISHNSVTKLAKRRVDKLMVRDGVGPEYQLVFRLGLDNYQVGWSGSKCGVSRMFPPHSTIHPSGTYLPSRNRSDSRRIQQTRPYRPELRSGGPCRGLLVCNQGGPPEDLLQQEGGPFHGAHQHLDPLEVQAGEGEAGGVGASRQEERLDEPEPS